MLNFPVIPASHATLRPTAGRRAAAFFNAVARSAWLRYRRWWTARELSRLDDRTLHDIGLHRSEIDAIARHRVATRYGANLLGR